MISCWYSKINNYDFFRIDLATVEQSKNKEKRKYMEPNLVSIFHKKVFLQIKSIQTFIIWTKIGNTVFG
jgi:hypothetical protein